MDSDIIATLIQENEDSRNLLDHTTKELHNKTKELNDKSKELHHTSKQLEHITHELEYISKENEEIREHYTLILGKLRDEEEISKVLSKRIEIVEQDFRRYVEKMQIYLSYTQKPIEPINDEIGYEKPSLYRSTNQHEWNYETDTLICSLDI